MNLYLLLLVYSTLMTASPAHDITAELEKINKAIYRLDRVSFTITYSVYSTHASTQPHERQVGTFKKSGKAIFSSSFGTETYQNDSLTCIVNHSDKTIFLQPINQSKAISPLNQNLLPQFQTLLPLCREVKHLTLSPQSSKLIFILPAQSVYEKIEITFDTESYLTNKIAIFYRAEQTLEDNATAGKPKLEVTCSNFNTQPVFAPGELSISKYLTYRNGKYATAPAYSTYTLIQD